MSENFFTNKNMFVQECHQGDKGGAGEGCVYVHEVHGSGPPHTMCARLRGCLKGEQATFL